MRYVDGYVLPVPRKNLQACGRTASMTPSCAGRCRGKGRRRRFPGSLVAVGCLFVLIQAGLTGPVSPSRGT
jgi:hypothetical protein